MAVMIAAEQTGTYLITYSSETSIREQEDIFESTDLVDGREVAIRELKTAGESDGIAGKLSDVFRTISKMPDNTIAVMTRALRDTGSAIGFSLASDQAPAMWYVRLGGSHHSGKLSDKQVSYLEKTFQQPIATAKRLTAHSL